MAETKVASNEDVLREWIAIAAAAEFDRIPEIWAEDMVLHAGALGEAHGPEQMMALFAQVATAFPDLSVVIQQLVSEGDRIAAVYRFTGTHKATYFGFEPTGRKFDVMAFGLYRIADGRIAEAWAFDDSLTIFDHLGVLPDAG